MRFAIEAWNDHDQGYREAVVGDSRGVEGAEAIAKAFEDAGVTTTGCYRIRPEDEPDERPAFYDLTTTGDLLIRDTPCL